MGSILGGSQKSEVKMPEWAQRASQDAIATAKDIGKTGYMPYYGPEVAAFTPMQEAGMQGAYDAAAAFGLASPGGNAMAGVPQAQEFEGGLRGYSSGDLFEQARQEFASRNPQQAAQYNKQFVPYGTPETNQNYSPSQGSGIPYTDPVTGEMRYFSWPGGLGFGGY